MRNTAIPFVITFLGLQLAFGQDLAITKSRPVRYTPDRTDFVIHNGSHFFNRPLYGPHTPFHIDAGDKPEFALLSTAIKDGVLRIGIVTDSQTTWLSDETEITTRYRPGSMIYQFPESKLEIEVLPLPDSEGIILKAHLDAPSSAKLAWVFGGIGSLRNNTVAIPAGDVITRSNVNSIRAIDEIDGRDLGPQLSLRPAQCESNQVSVSGRQFEIRSGAEIVDGAVSAGSVLPADAGNLEKLADVLASKADHYPLAAGASALDSPVYLAVWRQAKPLPSADLAAEFIAAQKRRQEITSSIVVDTPDAYINAVPAAMAVAGDACWQSPTWMHGAVSWRTPLLGWRGAYIGDALGWHDRAEAYFRYWASRQNTSDDFPTVARANPARNLAENDGKMLHSNGSIPQSHYDMNLVFIDALFRHLMWTGDKKLAADLFPVIQRHLAWEKRCFDRDGLYEGYACIWASDALQYNGGGAAHSTAYNEFHNRMAAAVARWIGQDPTPYEAEANRIHKAMQSKLWMPKLGWYAEYLDVLGEKQLHPAAALWSIYHPIDSRVTDPFQAWQCTRYVDTSLAHIPVRGPGVPDDGYNYHVLPESNWMPYEWSLNNVVTAENTHTALAYWEAGRFAEAFTLFKSTMLDTMYMGNTPGNLPNLSAYDPYRGETYTDFGDPTGITSRAFVEGLFGIQPDAIAGELLIHPGFPMSWNHAAIRTHDVSYTMAIKDRGETWSIDSHFPLPMRLRLRLPARSDRIASVTVNRAAAPWKSDDSAIGQPIIEIATKDPAPHYDVAIQWSGAEIAVANNPISVAPRDSVPVNYGPAKLLHVYDPQDTLSNGNATGEPGYRTAFAQVHQGNLTWWLPIEFEIHPPAEVIPAIAFPPGAWVPIDISSIYNDKVTSIFQNSYLTPRPQTCSLQMPLHGIGDWTGPTRGYLVDDSGLRRAAGPDGVYTLPDKTPFKIASAAGAKNIAFTSQWDNYPRKVTIGLSGTASSAELLLAGSTNAIESRVENGEIVVEYTDGTQDRLPLVNPTNWWPIDKNYRQDDYAFRLDAPVPTRVSLATGRAYRPADDSAPPGGSATVVSMKLNRSKELKSLTLHTESYEIVIGVMGLSLERPQQ